MIYKSLDTKNTLLSDVTSMMFLYADGCSSQHFLLKIRSETDPAPPKWDQENAKVRPKSRVENNMLKSHVV